MALTQPTARADHGAGRCPQGGAHCPATHPGAILTHSAGTPDARYTHLREHHPVFHDPEFDLWVLSRHQDIDTVLRDATGTYSTALSYTPIRPLGTTADAALAAGGAVPVLSSTDPPEHTRFRQAMTATFPTTDRAVRAPDTDRAMAEETAAVAATFAADPGRTGDLLTGYAQPAVMAAFGRLAGVPRAGHRAVVAQAAALTDLVWGRPDPDRQLQAAHALAGLWTYCADLVARRQHLPCGGDLLDAWTAHTGADGERMSPAEVASTLMEQLIVVGELLPRAVVTTVAGLRAAGPWPPPQDGVVSEAVETTFRYHSPLVGWLRSTTREVELAGTTVPAGARLLLLLASAHRDPDRAPNAPSLSFGAGIHYCPGAAYTRRLVHHAVTALATACPALTLTDPADTDPTRWNSNTGVGGPTHLTVSW
ncbi:hypothetical protein ACIRYZ_24260 [Kitasatospora sp. NPDC101155]|uniref:hypothetical protein n=1 Tax=Kitasatospora sp. NPDC101155 TaxID=3364097 RepID=UPI00382128CF